MILCPGRHQPTIEIHGIRVGQIVRQPHRLPSNDPAF